MLRPVSACLQARHLSSSPGSYHHYQFHTMCRLDLSRSIPRRTCQHHRPYQKCRLRSNRQAPTISQSRTLQNRSFCKASQRIRFDSMRRSRQLSAWSSRSRERATPWSFSSPSRALNASLLASHDGASQVKIRGKLFQRVTLRCPHLHHALTSGSHVPHQRACYAPTRVPSTFCLFLPTPVSAPNSVPLCLAVLRSKYAFLSLPVFPSPLRFLDLQALGSVERSHLRSLSARLPSYLATREVYSHRPLFAAAWRLFTPA
mmetsp:Transcript_14299/g.17070  ORF Transcript_14299/g.17070 Transcript_14299/m.17070 type:complete len:259 (-) Transcript_14299:796-1572(-)